MTVQLAVIVVMVTFDGGTFDGSVPLAGRGLLAITEKHPFDLTVGPRTARQASEAPPSGMSDFREPMFDPVFLASHIEHVGHAGSGWPIIVSRRKGELDCVVSKNNIDFVGHRFDERFQEG